MNDINGLHLIRRDGRDWLCCPKCNKEQTYLVRGQVINHEKFRCKNCGEFFIANNCFTAEDN